MSPIHLTGNITTKDTEHGAYTYQYDELYRLTQAINPTISDEAYTYDLLGNRLTSANTTGSWTYNVNNELGGYDNVSYVYDANGNLTNKTSGANPTNPTNYIYDVEDRLVRVEDGDGVVATYYYDPFGRRLWKEVDGTRTHFLYSDEGLIGEYDSIGNEIKTYGWTPNSTWGTDPLFQKIGSTYYFYQNDHQGTPQKLIGTNGLVLWAGVYDSFGNCQVEVEGITNNLRFPGQYYDQETGLHYNWLRYYDPATARYLSTDPFDEGLNLYVYCFNNPPFWIDPLGLCAVSAAGRRIKRASDWLRNMAIEVIDTSVGYWGNKLKNFNWLTFGYGAFEVTIGIQLIVTGSGVILSTGPIGVAPGVIAVYEGMFLIGVGLTDIIGAFSGNEPIASKLPEKIGRIPFRSIVYPVPPDVSRENKKDSSKNRAIRE